MVHKKSNQILNLDFFWDVFDLKEYVFIDLRKQIRQKMEGIGASQF